MLRIETSDWGSDIQNIKNLSYSTRDEVQAKTLLAKQAVKKALSKDMSESLILSNWLMNG